MTRQLDDKYQNKVIALETDLLNLRSILRYCGRLDFRSLRTKDKLKIILALHNKDKRKLRNILTNIKENTSDEMTLKQADRDWETKTH